MSKFANSADDFIGKLALCIFLLRENADKEPAITAKLAQVDDGQVALYRATAEHMTEKFFLSYLKDKLEAEKNAAGRKAYEEVLQTHFQALATSVEDELRVLRSELKEATSWSRQVIWAVVAAFAFAVVVTLAQLIPNPFTAA